MKEEFLEIKEIKQLGDLEIEKFRDELIKAVRLRLIAEVPVGTCLSGGLDSSTIVLLVNQLLKNNVKEAESVGKIQKTFSAVFPGGSNNEEKYVDEVLKSIKLESHKVKPKPEQFFEEIEEFIKTQEEPTISTGPYAQYKVIQEASKHVTVLLDGQGSDEMMGGYNPYYFVYFRQLLKNKQYFTFLKEVVSSLDIIWHALIYRLIEVIGIKKRISIVKLLDNRFVEQYNNEKFTTTTNHLKKRLIEDIFANSLPSLLRYEDRNSMRFSIEGRVPFLDFNLLKYLFSLPDRAIINLGWNKNILRKSIKNLLPKLIVERRNKIGFTTPEYQWFMRMKNKIYQIFLSGSFANRKYFNQSEVLKAIQLFIEDKVDDTMVFWRLLNLELWLRVFFDPPSSRRSSGLRRDKPLFNPNEGKRLEIEAEGKKYLRYPVKTELFKKGDDYVKKITKSIVTWLNGYTVKNSNETMKQFNNAKFFLVISEKIVAISQGRSYFLWEIKPGFWANLLSKFVTKTPYGIGLGSSWTMQLAIQEVGLGKIIYATIVHQIAKLFGIRGMFYKVTGQTVRSIDGPTEYSLYPSNVSAKLGPKEPEKEAEKISLSLRALAKQSLKEIASSPMAPRDDQWMENFLGVVIIDANDLGQNVLGNSTSLDNKLIEKIFSDNPMGQADEQTPLTIVSIC